MTYSSILQTYGDGHNSENWTYLKYRLTYTALGITLRKDILEISLDIYNTALGITLRKDIFEIPLDIHSLGNNAEKGHT